DRGAKVGRPSGARHLTAARGSILENHGALGDNFTARDGEANELRRGLLRGRLLERPAADEVLGLVELHDPVHRGVEWRRLRVGVLAHEHVQFLQAEDALWLEAEGGDDNGRIATLGTRVAAQVSAEDRVPEV